MKKTRFEAAEILSTAWCPYNCKYCYIPKGRAMEKMHQQVAKDLKNGAILDNLENVAGENLHYLSFWGTEPSLTLNIIEEKLPEIQQRFPELREINFSTSMMRPKPIEDFAKTLSKYDNLKLKVQISLDGPAFITDKNRFEGAAKTIPEKFFWLVSQLQDLQSKVEFRWKGTFTIENIKEINRDPARIDQYFNFFKNLNEKFNKMNRNKNIILIEESYGPTLAVPGKYTSQDGKDFAIFINNLRRKDYRTTYFPRLRRLVSFQDELGPKKAKFTCCAGDSSLGIGYEQHMCHRSYYLDDDRYINSILEQEDIDNWDISLFKRGNIDLMRRSFIVDTDNDEEKVRFNYIMRNFHDFWRMQIGYVKATMKELALAGQAEKRFLKNDAYLTLFAIFVNTALCCPMENVLNTGSVYLTPISLLRMFGNGAFRELLIKYYEATNRK